RPLGRCTAQAIDLRCSPDRSPAPADGPTVPLALLPVSVGAVAAPPDARNSCLTEPHDLPLVSAVVRPSSHSHVQFAEGVLSRIYEAARDSSLGRATAPPRSSELESFAF